MDFCNIYEQWRFSPLLVGCLWKLLPNTKNFFFKQSKHSYNLLQIYVGNISLLHTLLGKTLKFGDLAWGSFIKKISRIEILHRVLKMENYYIINKYVGVISTPPEQFHLFKFFLRQYISMCHNFRGLIKLSL